MALVQEPRVQYQQVTPDSSHTALPGSGPSTQEGYTYPGHFQTAYESYLDSPQPIQPAHSNLRNGSEVGSEPAPGFQRTASRPPHTCEHCGKAYKNKNTLTRHINLDHVLDVRRPTCPVPGCAYSPKRQDSLRRHIEPCRVRWKLRQKADVESHTSTARWNDERPWSELQVPAEATRVQGYSTVGALDCMMAQRYVLYSASHQKAQTALSYAVAQRKRIQDHKNRLGSLCLEYPHWDRSNIICVMEQLDIELDKTNKAIAHWKNILDVAEGTHRPK